MSEKNDNTILGMKPLTAAFTVAAAGVIYATAAAFVAPATLSVACGVLGLAGGGIFALQGRPLLGGLIALSGGLNIFAGVIPPIPPTGPV